MSIDLPDLIASLVKRGQSEITLVVGLVGLAFGAALFLNIADEVTEGETHAMDLRILMALRSPGDPTQPIGPHWLQSAAADLTALGSIAVLGVIILVVVGLFIGLRRWREAVGLLFASGGGVALSQGLKLVYGRERPPMSLHAVDVVNASFPSGHAMLTAAVYLTLGALVARFAEKRRVKVFAMVAAMLITLLVGLTRVYLGVHWPTDVLAGWCVGSAWATLCWLLAFIWERQSGKRLTTDAALSDAGPDGAAPDAALSSRP